MYKPQRHVKEAGFGMRSAFCTPMEKLLVLAVCSIDRRIPSRIFLVHNVWRKKRDQLDKSDRQDETLKHLQLEVCGLRTPKVAIKSELRPCLKFPLFCAIRSQ
jgi:hypothetical protein